MRLRFWKREKKKEEELLDLKFDKNVRENTFKKFEPIELSGVTDLGDLSMADNITDEDLEKWTDLDDLPDQIKITKGQCIGYKKSGERCTRIVDTVYCYQHNKRS